MNRRNFIMLCLLLSTVALQTLAQNAIPLNLKFGAPTQEEMEVKVCPYDVDAKAMVLSCVTDGKSLPPSSVAMRYFVEKTVCSRRESGWRQGYF